MRRGRDEVWRKRPGTLCSQGCIEFACGCDCHSAWTRGVHLHLVRRLPQEAYFSHSKRQFVLLADCFGSPWRSLDVYQYVIWNGLSLRTPFLSLR
jgi:hypothetical protein